jgi:hypothetical protein
MAVFLSAQGLSPNAQNLVEPSPSHDREKQQVSTPTPNVPAVRIESPESGNPESAPNQNQAHANEKLTTYDLWSLVAQYLIFVATLIYAGVAIYQLRAIKSTADAARAAVQNYRQFILVTKMERDEMGVTVTYRNAGIGPADIVEVVAASTLVSLKIPKEHLFNYFAPLSYVREDRRRRFTPVLAAQDESSIGLLVDQEHFDQTGGKVYVGIHGIFKYRGASYYDPIYETKLFWWSSKGGSFFVGSTKMNERN